AAIPTAARTPSVATPKDLLRRICILLVVNEPSSIDRHRPGEAVESATGDTGDASKLGVGRRGRGQRGGAQAAWGGGLLEQAEGGVDGEGECGHADRGSEDAGGVVAG